MCPLSTPTNEVFTMMSDFLNTVAPVAEGKKRPAAQQVGSKAPSDVDTALCNTQGYIMVGHGREHVWHALVRFRAGADPETLRQKLQEVVNLTAEEDGSAPTPTTNLIDPEKRQCADLVVSALGFTWRGYQRMGFADCDERFSLEFQQGFAMRSQEITGRGVDDWDPVQWNPQNGYHALLILAAGRGHKEGEAQRTCKPQPDGKRLDGMALLKERKEKVTEALKEVADITWLKGETRRKKLDTENNSMQAQKPTGNGSNTMLAQKPIEPFGFTDGVSQPELLTWGNVKGADKPFPSSGWLRGAAPSLVLIREPICREQDQSEFGSYMAFLNIEQHVDLFNQAAQDLAKKLNIDLAAAQALIVGRKQNGEPLACAGSDANDFADKTDATGAKWPFACHTRKMNSRQPGQEHHRIVRRGVTYTDGKLEGTYFQCFQADLQEQFEFLFKRWGNFRSQPQTGCGVDPLVGLDPNHPQQWPKPGAQYGNVPETTGFTISELTTIRGGEYFYFPSIPFLNAIEDRWKARHPDLLPAAR
jgi:deferrochelatase/peroxidase EfeB